MDARFLRACSSEADLPEPDLPEVAVAGRSNCGKSSLINALTGRSSLARTSSTPGRTQQIVFFEVSLPGAPAFWLVDLPGYGYAHASKEAQRRWIALVERYIETRSSLQVLVVLADLRREPAEEERSLLTWATERELASLVLLTKADKLSKSQRFGAVQRARRALSLDRTPLAVSTRDPESIVAARQALVDAITSRRSG
jgi:GTP-binding protein